MENSEQVSGGEPTKNSIQKGSIRPNPTRNNRTNLGGSSDSDPAEPRKENSEFDSSNNESEINPAELDNEEVNLGDAGKDDSQNNSVPDIQAQQELQQGSNNRGNSGGAGGAQYGKGANTPNSADSTQGQRASSPDGNSSKLKPAQENLLGQGGYGTSGTSGTNSGGKQGYQSGIGSAGSQNGSTGYNAGSLGTKIEPNKNVDLN